MDRSRVGRQWKTQISHAIAAAHRERRNSNKSISGYLPSTGGRSVGMFFGFRKK